MCKTVLGGSRAAPAPRSGRGEAATRPSEPRSGERSRPPAPPWYFTFFGWGAGGGGVWVGRGAGGAGRAARFRNSDISFRGLIWLDQRAQGSGGSEAGGGV